MFLTLGILCVLSLQDKKLPNDKHEYNKSPHIVKLRLYEKVSQRYETMKQEDQLCELDLIDNFWQRIRELMASLQIQSIDPLMECLPEEHREGFSNLVNGISPRFDRLQKEK